MNSVTADSFLFRSKFQPSKRATPRKRLPATSKPELTATIPIAEEKVPIEDNITLLQAYRVYVDRKLTDYKYYEELAKAQGATVLQDPKEGISVLVHGPKDQRGKLSKLVSVALENHVHVVSPTWLRQCYVDRKVHDPHLYPCDASERKKLVNSQPQLEDDNPFGIPLPEDTNESTPINHSNHNIPQQQEVVAVEEVEEEEEETEQTPTPVPAINNATVKELLNRKRKEQEEKQKSKSKKPKKKDASLTSFFGNSNKMSLWYGESSRKP